MSSSYTSPPESFFSSSYSSSSPLRLYNYIGGRFVPPVSAQYIDNLAPATSKVLTFIPRSSGADVELAVSAAKAAFLQWKNTSAEERAVYLDRIAALIESRLDSFARIEYEDTGKPYGLCKRLDIPRSISNFRYFGGAIRHDSTECHSMSDAFNYTTRSPVGIAGLITPWNLPLYLLSWKIAPALAMGNVIIAKPSELTPNTAAALAELVHEIGLPPGVFNLVHGYGYEVGEAIVAHPEIPLISFTGGTVTGRKVSSIAAPLFKKCSLELGGKNATVIFNDCDFDLTVAQTVRAAFSNQGQICLCGSRVFIEQGIYDKFIDAMVKQTQKYKIGDPNSEDLFAFGSLNSLPHRDKIESYVELARKDGGIILCGGKRPTLPEPFCNGAFYEPTIIAGLPVNHKCSMEEIFGPVVTVHPFSSEKEVLDYVNSVRYGLAGSLWTSNLSRAHRFAKAWETGMVWVNCWLHRDLRVPFGGIKESGLGTEGGRHSLEFYSNTKNICIHNGS